MSPLAQLWPVATQLWPVAAFMAFALAVLGAAAAGVTLHPSGWHWLEHHRGRQLARAVLAARRNLTRLCRPLVHRTCPCRRPLPPREWWDDIEDRAWPHAEWAIVLLDFSREQERDERQRWEQ